MRGEYWGHVTSSPPITAHLDVVPGGVLVTRGLGLPGLDDGEGVAAELLEQPGGDAARALLNMETSKNIFAKTRERDPKHKNCQCHCVLLDSDEGYFRELSEESVHYS